MDGYLGIILGGMVGLLVGMVTTAFTIYPKMMSKFAAIRENCSTHKSEIQTLFRDRDRQEKQLGEILQLIKSVVDQNRLIIGRILGDESAKK